MYKLLMLALCVVGVVSQSLPCENNMSCRDCIRDNEVCVWCAADDRNYNNTRCVVKYKATEDWCPKPFHQRPTASAGERPGGTENAHIQPRRFKLKLLPGEAVNFTFSVNTSAINYPIDVYFVIDAFDGGSKVRKYYEFKTNKIIGALKTITENISFGFGTFVTQTVNPLCDDPASKYLLGIECPSFKHHVTLTSDYTKFQQTLAKYPAGSKSALHVSGLDGVGQAITCKQFGWRDGSVKIVVPMTITNITGVIHVAAGDNKLATKQYDGKCNTDTDRGLYDKEPEIDFPSVDMINKLATDNNVTILFSFGGNGPKSHNDDIAHNISGSSVLYDTHFVNEDLLHNEIKRITERINKQLELKVQYKENIGRNFKITFNPDCTKDADAFKLVEDRIYNFTASVTMLRYEGVDNYSIELTVPGVTDKLTLDVEVIKQCECESKIGNSAHFGGNTPQNDISTNSENPYNKEGPNSFWSYVGRKPHRFWRRITKYEVYEEGSDVPLAREDRSSRGQTSDS